MSRPSRTGIRGLFRGADDRYRIDLRWREAGTGEHRRHQELLPAGINAASAKERARKILGAALAGGFDPKRTAPKKLGEAIAAYLAWATTNRPKTYADRRSLGNVLLAGIGDVPLEDLSPFHVERYKRDRLASGTAPATINRGVAMLKHLLGMAPDLGLGTPSTAEAIRKMKPMKEPPGRVRYLVGDESERLFAELPENLRPLVVTALLTGMRKEEVWSLRKSEVDLARREITRVKTKTGNVLRIPINEALAPVLDAAIKASTSELVFQNKHRLSKGTFAMSITKRYPEAVARASIEDLTLHDLRHDFATRLRRGDVGLDVIAKLLGHSSLAMTQRYAHVGSDTLRSAVGALPLPQGAATASPLPETRNPATAKVLRIQTKAGNP